MEIRYKMTWQDRNEAIRIGWPLMSLGWRFYLIGSDLACFCGLLLMFWARGYHAQWPLTGPFPWSTLRFVLTFPCYGVPIFFAVIPLMWHLTARRLVKIDAFALTTKHGLGGEKLKWAKVLEIRDTGKYVYFRIDSPVVIVVPTSAFPNKEQAHAFTEQAGRYWRRATGREEPPTPNPAVVWPPAPSVAHSQEPDSRA